MKQYVNDLLQKHFAYLNSSDAVWIIICTLMKLAFDKKLLQTRCYSLYRFWLFKIDVCIKQNSLINNVPFCLMNIKEFPVLMSFWRLKILSINSIIVCLALNHVLISDAIWVIIDKCHPSIKVNIIIDIWQNLFVYLLHATSHLSYFQTKGRTTSHEKDWHSK